MEEITISLSNDSLLGIHPVFREVLQYVMAVDRPLQASEMKAAVDGLFQSVAEHRKQHGLTTRFLGCEVLSAQRFSKRFPKKEARAFRRRRRRTKTQLAIFLIRIEGSWDGAAVDSFLSRSLNFTNTNCADVCADRLSHEG